jgi:hypothetical protein
MRWQRARDLLHESVNSAEDDLDSIWSALIALCGSKRFWGFPGNPSLAFARKLGEQHLPTPAVCSSLALPLTNALPAPASPATTSPVLIPKRSPMREPKRLSNSSFKASSRPSISAAARTARSVSSSWAAGRPQKRNPSGFSVPQLVPSLVLKQGSA